MFRDIDPDKINLSIQSEKVEKPNHWDGLNNLTLTAIFDWARQIFIQCLNEINEKLSTQLKKLISTKFTYLHEKCLEINDECIMKANISSENQKSAAGIYLILIS